MFEAIDQAKSGFLTLPSQGLSISWFISTVLLTSLGFYMYPHAFGAIYSGKNEKTFRKNTIIMPLYQLIFLFVFFAGFAAMLQIPGLKGDEVDLSRSVLDFSLHVIQRPRGQSAFMQYGSTFWQSGNSFSRAACRNEYSCCIVADSWPYLLTRLI